MSSSCGVSGASSTDTGRMILRYRQGNEQHTYPDLRVTRPSDSSSQTTSTAGTTLGRRGKSASDALSALVDIQGLPPGTTTDTDMWDGGERITWSPKKTERNAATDKTITAIFHEGFPGSEASYTLNPAMYQVKPGDLTQWKEVLRAIPTDLDTSVRSTRETEIELTGAEKAALKAWQREHERTVELRSDLTYAQTVRQLHAHLESSYKEGSELAPSIRTLRESRSGRSAQTQGLDQSQRRRSRSGRRGRGG